MNGEAWVAGLTKEFVKTFISKWSQFQLKPLNGHAISNLAIIEVNIS